MKQKALLTLFFFFFSVAVLASNTLPLPANLIGFSSPKGQQLFQDSQCKQAFYKLMPYFITERGLAYCGIASSVMVLNALSVRPPLTPSHAPYRIFNQHNFFTKKVVKHLTPSQVSFVGASLRQIATALKTFGVRLAMYSATQVSLKQFRDDAIKAVSSTHQFMIVNFCRKSVDEKGCGHFSPLAAYNKKSDRFLLLDVARYKYPPVWVKAEQLYQSIRVHTDLAKGDFRGYLIVG